MILNLCNRNTEKEEAGPALRTAVEIVLEKGNVTDELFAVLLDNEEIVATAQLWKKSVQKNDESEKENLSEKLCHMVYRQHGQDR